MNRRSGYYTSQVRGTVLSPQRAAHTLGLLAGRQQVGEGYQPGFFGRQLWFPGQSRKRPFSRIAKKKS